MLTLEQAKEQNAKHSKELWLLAADFAQRLSGLREVKEVYAFGSLAKGTANNKSDLDLAVVKVAKFISLVCNYSASVKIGLAERPMC